ncbi:unnamed protein product, partial [Notodromas monacha]
AFVINDKQVFEMKLNYDAGNRIAESRVTVGRSTRQEQLGYDADGHLRFVKGRRSFEYSYDANGNCVRIAEEGETWMLSYDKADRLTDFGEHVWNRYDSDGRVRQTRDIRFTYNSKSQLMHAVQPDGFRRWYIYDHRDRLAAWLDDRGNRTQFLYGDPTHPHRVTHIFYPVTKQTLLLVYNHLGHLISLDDAGRKYVVATDQVGSPLALFDTRGGVAKEIVRAPFGRVAEDTNPGIHVPLDFHGGIRDPLTQLVHFPEGVYDPFSRQWLNPRWTDVLHLLPLPAALFPYRFKNNDPTRDIRFTYNSKSQLMHAVQPDGFRRWYIYDHRDRLAAWLDDRGNRTQFLYGDPTHPHRVTHIFYPVTKQTLLLVYNHLGHLISLDDAGRKYVVATDQVGSPLALFDTRGGVAKEIVRAPFGRVAEDTNPGIHVPLDFHGGIRDPLTQLVHFPEGVYDPFSRQWLNPRWTDVLHLLPLPAALFPYRFKNNDPVNPGNPGGAPSLMGLEDWIKYFGYNWENLLAKEYLQHSWQKSLTAVPKLPDWILPNFEVGSGLDCFIRTIDANLRTLDFSPVSSIRASSPLFWPAKLPSLAHKSPPFGRGITVSNEAGRAVIADVRSANAILRDVVTSVLNNSHFLDFHVNAGPVERFYFVKTNVARLDDVNLHHHGNSKLNLEQLRRIIGVFTVNAEKTKTGSEVTVTNSEAEIVIRYGESVVQEKSSILKELNKMAVEKAWEREADMAVAGAYSLQDWSQNELAQLLKRGKVNGYHANQIHSVYEYPDLVDDPANVLFVKSTKNRRTRRKIRKYQPGFGQFSYR